MKWKKDISKFLNFRSLTTTKEFVIFFYKWLFWNERKNLFLFCVQTNEAIRYLEFCIQSLGVKDQAIHNYLLSLYAKIKPDQLMTYLLSQGQVSPAFCLLK